MQPVVVALVLAPSSEETLRRLPIETPVWIASTPEMQATIEAAENAKLQITLLYPNGTTPTQWLVNHLDSVDQHHNELSQMPPYSKLLVFGVAHSSSLLPLLQEFGFVIAWPESFGFGASKLQCKSSLAQAAAQ